MIFDGHRVLVGLRRRQVHRLVRRFLAGESVAQLAAAYRVADTDVAQAIRLLTKRQ